MTIWGRSIHGERAGVKVGVGEGEGSRMRAVWALWAVWVRRTRRTRRTMWARWRGDVCACACVRVCVCACVRVCVSSTYGIGHVPVRFEVLAERIVGGVEGGASDEELSMARCVERACVERACVQRVGREGARGAREKKVQGRGGGAGRTRGGGWVGTVTQMHHVFGICAFAGGGWGSGGVRRGPG